MAKLKIYGAPMSRAFRTIWCANEIGVDYELIPVAPADAKGHADVKRLNPNGSIPVIDDDGVVLWESMAINLYLANKGKKLWPEDEAVRGHCGQWTLWAVNNLEADLLNVLLNKMRQTPSDDVANASREKLKGPLAILNTYLQNRQYLCGNEFTVGDLNVASVLAWGQMVKLDMSAYPKVQEWLQRCLSRPGADMNKVKSAAAE